MEQFQPSAIRPSYKSGYAEQRSESAHPELWDGLIAAYCPFLGTTGSRVHDVSGFCNHGTLFIMGAPEWNIHPPAGPSLGFYGGPGNRIVFDRTLNAGKIHSVLISWFWNSVGFAHTGWTRWDGIGPYFPYLNNPDGPTGKIFYRTSEFVSVTHRGFQAIGDFVCYGVRRKNAAINFYETGKPIGTEQTLGGPNLDWIPTAIGCMNVDTNNLNADFVSAYVYDRELTDREFLLHYIDPMAPMRLKVRTIVSITAPPAGVVVLRRRIEAA